MLATSFAVATEPALAQNGNTGDSRLSVHAARIEEAIAVDGALDEEAWRTATAVSGFHQFEPNEGDPASQRTEVRVLYGDDNLYVGAMLYDDNPAFIEQALGRRDDYNRADWFLVLIDSYFDRRNAAVFGVSAAGVQYDAALSSGGRPGGPDGPGDTSWDAVWFSEVRRTSEGWSVEMSIPYSMLRFSDAASQTWGVQFRRRIPRLGEQSEWPLVRRTERENLVAQFRQLTDIEGISPRRNVQIRPYTATRLHTKESAEEAGTRASSSSFDAGGDVKIGLGPNITLDATVNPDFGQVEADPAVLNLTAFETDLEERRPFFVEGAQLFDFRVGRGEILYTRRIGAEAPILGASKLSGRTASNLSFGALLATTGHDFSPTSHYGTVRMSQQIGQYSSLGGIVTGFDGPVVGGSSTRRRSVVSGTDWDLRFSDNRYGIEGFVVLSHRSMSEGLSGSSTGLAARLRGQKRQGAWQGHVTTQVLGDTFNPNDVGQLNRVNSITTFSQVEREINGGQPFGPFLRGNVEVSARQRFSYREGYNLGQGFQLESRWTFHGTQQLRLDVDLENPIGGYDIYETRGLGPWAQPTTLELRSDFETDERRRWRIEPQMGITFDGDGGRVYQVGMRSNWNVGSRLSLSTDLEGEWERGVMAWLANESFRRNSDETWAIGTQSASPSNLEGDDYVSFDDQAQLDGILNPVSPYSLDHYFVPVFGARDTRSLDLTLRGTYTFMPNLSLQAYSQLFLAHGRYGRFQILQDRDTLVPFASFPKREEFAFENLQSNVVLRWQYRPGSTLFVVWSHSRSADDELNPLAPWERSPYNRSINGQIGDALGAFPANTFSIKLTYTFLPS